MTAVRHHLAELVQRQRPADGSGPRFYARCRCNWIGPDRPTVQAANNDAIAHEQMSNQQGNADER